MGACGFGPSICMWGYDVMMLVFMECGSGVGLFEVCKIMECWKG